MATLKGTWRFNQTITLPEFFPALSGQAYNEAVKFSSADGEYLYFVFKHAYLISGAIKNLEYKTTGGFNTDEAKVTSYSFDINVWENETYRLVDFGTTEQEVSDEFYAWLTANATQQLTEEETPETPQIVSITYGGAELTTLGADETVSLHTSEKRMAGDVEVTITAKDYDGSVVVEGEPNEPSYVPVEIATEAEMTALLDTAEVGSVYKYTGESGTYENGALYVVEESE